MDIPPLPAQPALIRIESLPIQVMLISVSAMELAHTLVSIINKLYQELAC